MRYWLVLGVHEAKFVANISKALGLLRTPRHAEVRVLVVENGAGIGAWKTPGSIVLKSDQGVVPFLNTALAWLKENSEPGDWFVRMDIDDFYGSTYLLGVDVARKLGAECTGISAPYVRTEEGRLYFCKNINPGYASGAVGGSLAGEISKALPFKAEKSWGEDLTWVRGMHEKGGKYQERSSVDFALCRWSDHTHTYPVRGEEIPHVWLCDAYYLGTWDEKKIQQDGPQDGEPIQPDPRKTMSAVRRLEVL